MKKWINNILYIFVILGNLIIVADILNFCIDNNSFSTFYISWILLCFINILLCIGIVIMKLLLKEKES